MPLAAYWEFTLTHFSWALKCLASCVASWEKIFMVSNMFASKKKRCTCQHVQSCCCFIIYQVLIWKTSDIHSIRKSNQSFLPHPLQQICGYIKCTEMCSVVEVDRENDTVGRTTGTSESTQRLANMHLSVNKYVHGDGVVHSVSSQCIIESASCLWQGWEPNKEPSCDSDLVSNDVTFAAKTNHSNC